MPSNSKLEFERKRKKQYRDNKNPEQDITETIQELIDGNTKAQVAKMMLKAGRVLGFDRNGSRTYLEIGRVEGGRYYAKEVELHDPTLVSSHLHHNIDGTGEAPICLDCEVPITEPSTPKGRAAFEARKERYLADGTPIDEDYNEEQ